MMRNSRQGFSLFEVLIAIGVSAVIVVVLGKFSGTISGIGTLINNELQADQDIALAFGELTTELRSMTVSDAGAYPLEVAASSSIIFFSDVDMDGATERVRYVFSSSTFERGITRSTGNPAIYPTSSEAISLIAPSVLSASSTFEYFDSDYTGSEPPLSPPINIADVRIVRVTLTAEVSTSTAPRPITLTNTITIRNLRSN